MSNDSSYNSEDEQQYVHKIRHTNELINHLESKLQTYIKPIQHTPDHSVDHHTASSLLSRMRQQAMQQSPEMNESNVLTGPVFSFHQNRFKQELSLSHMTDQPSILKSKVELEREVREFDAKVRKIATQTSLPTFPSQGYSQGNFQVQELSIPIDQTNLMRIENQSQSERYQQQYESEASSRLYRQQELILHNINEKLNRLQQQDDDECVQLEQQISAMQEQQVDLLDERNRALEEQNELQKVVNDLQLAQKQMLKKILSDDSQVIIEDQKQKISKIKRQSESLLKDENVKLKKYEIQLEIIQKEKLELQRELTSHHSIQGELESQKIDITHQLNNLIKLHNQMLQTDLRKTITTIQNTPSHSERSEQQSRESPQKAEQKKHTQSSHRQVVNQIEFLYKLNVQLKDTMEQQLNNIRGELGEQKQLNQELLKAMRSRDQQPPAPLELTEDQQNDIKLSPIKDKTPPTRQVIDLKSIKVENWEEMMGRLKNRHKINTKTKSQARIPKVRQPTKQTVEYKDRFNRTFQDQILQLNEMIANQLQTIKG